MLRVTIYMKPTCPYSRRALGLLQTKAEDLDVRDVSASHEQRQEMEERCGAHTVPQIFIGEMHIGGCDALLALDDDGRLDGMLTGEQAQAGA